MSAYQQQNELLYRNTPLAKAYFALRNTATLLRKHYPVKFKKMYIDAVLNNELGLATLIKVEQGLEDV